MLKAEGVVGNYLEYKGRPLVRQESDIYYGDLSENYHVCMMIMTEKPSSKADETVPDKIVVQLFAKDAKAPEKQVIASGLADALDTADAWLERYNH